MVGAFESWASSFDGAASACRTRSATRAGAAPPHSTLPRRPHGPPRDDGGASPSASSAEPPGCGGVHRRPGEAPALLEQRRGRGWPRRARAPRDTSCLPAQMVPHRSPRVLAPSAPRGGAPLPLHGGMAPPRPAPPRAPFAPLRVRSLHRSHSTDGPAARRRSGQRWICLIPSVL